MVRHAHHEREKFIQIIAGSIGSQGVVSKILSGKREMNLRQMRALAIRFSVPLAAFVGGEGALAA